MKKELQKKLSFVLFVMAVFFAGMSLTVFQEYIWMACIAGVLLLATSVFYVLSQKEESTSPTEKTTELLLADRMAELMRGNEKAEKGVYIAVKKQHEAMESGMAALEAQIAELIKAQENAVKTLVMYNKENAKQMALSEREELGRLREELQLLQQHDGTSGSMSQVVEAVKEMSHRLYEEFHENGEAILSELESTADSLDEIKTEMKGLKERVPVVYNRDTVSVAEEESITVQKFEPEEELTDIPEPVVTEELPDISIPNPEPEEEPVDIPEPVAEEKPEEAPVSSGVDLSDPNKPLSADDIAALFAQANAVTEEPEEELPDISIPELEPEEEPVEIPEPVAEEKPEEAPASSGVDLSDPNKTLSADDIAALFAAMGN